MSAKRFKLSNPHPFGVRPLGNAILLNKSNEARDDGTGLLRVLSDESLLAVFGLLDAKSTASCSCCSRALYCFSNDEDVWRERTLGDFGSSYPFQGTWRRTYCFRKGGKVGNVTVRSKLFSDVLYQSWYCRTLEIPRRWWAVDTIPRVAASDLTQAEFVKRFDGPGKPVIITGACEGWGAMKKWSREYLEEVGGDSKFMCGPADMTLKSFFDYAHNTSDESPMFVFCKNFADLTPQLAADYETPQYFTTDLFTLLGEKRPHWRWLLAGGARSGSKWHVDPNSTSAWNAVIKGRKKWIMLPPGVVPPAVFPSADGAEVTQPTSLIEWFLNFYDQTRSLAVERWQDHQGYGGLVEGVCGPGELVFVPTGWWHAVLNLDDDTLAVTQNYVSKANVNSVRRFLRDKKDQISGLRSEAHRAGLAQDFDDALQEAALLDSVEVEKAKARAMRNDVQAGGGSFWDALRGAGGSLSFAR
mmetsp:Transcript_13991/g.33924  ORF Transcript_13991/g.33924 Transcript_13991/m.33924 type:complete len:471 (-) Transcript_13991:112-1524(-)